MTDFWRKLKRARTGHFTEKDPGNRKHRPKHPRTEENMTTVNELVSGVFMGGWWGSNTA